MGRRLGRSFALLLLGLLLAAVKPANAQKNRPAEAAGGDLAAFDAIIKPEDRQHWAFQPVRKPSPPAVKDATWVRNPIDAFILAPLEAEGWKPASPAAPRALLRRLYLDLIGLPPTLTEQEAFLKDRSPAAWERLIDDLLARPAYGERWARHWLDLVRYAESNGYERDATRPWIWRYRDYVIQAFNDDKPYDRFILEQLAGDELPDANADTLIATGYYRLGPWDDEPADPKEDRFDQLDDMVNTTSLTFLGLTLSCCRCHNHKFEALTMHDYYRMVAFFTPLERPTSGRTERDLPAGTRHEIARLAERDKTLPWLVRASLAHRLLPTGVPNAAPFDTSTVALRHVVPDLPRGYFLHEPTPKAPDTHLLIRGKAARPGPKVEPGLPAVLVRQQPQMPSPGPHTSLRRLTLARWIASPDNPLTARVIVNRVWQQHFGEGLVRSPSDFGVMGRAPTHPELLDWLAGWFVDNGWSLKKLHRLILTSNTYQMSKTWNKDYAAKDPENLLFWRFPYRRLEVEAIRDSMLAVSGKLNRTMYGPSMHPFVPKEALAGHSDPDKIWPTFDESTASRRTVYAHIKRSMVVPLLETLDLCDHARPSDRRAVTTVAPQALMLFNGDFVNRQARHLAERLVREVGDDPAKQVERAYLLALCRPPTERERQTMLRFLEHETASLRNEASGASTSQDATRSHAQRQLCRVILNLNEFVYPD
jgi:hypothetical protein